MTASDSPAVVEARRLAASYGETWRSQASRDIAAVVAGVLAELDEARRAPRVWLEGDTVPEGAWGLTDDEVHEYRQHVTREPIVEIVLPGGFDAAVAAERARRVRTTGT